MENKFQWGRLDEILMFIIALIFLLFLAQFNISSEAIATMAGSLIAVVPIYIKAALEQRNKNGHVNGNDKLPVVEDKVSVTTKNSQSPVENPRHFLREDK